MYVFRPQGPLEKRFPTCLPLARTELSKILLAEPGGHSADLCQAQLQLKKNIWMSVRKKEASWTDSPSLSPFSLSAASQRSDLLISLI